MSLLGPDDPPPYSVRNADAVSPLLFISDHNGVVVPKALDGLGVPPSEMRRHVAYDIGIADVAEYLSDRFETTLIHANYSRLVIDCNRDPYSPDAMPVVSDHTLVPGNRDLSDADRQARKDEILEPYQQAIAARLAKIENAGQAPILIALHSFTPIIDGVVRPWDIGIFWRYDDRLSRPLIDLLSADSDVTVGDNLPYSGRDRGGQTILRHTEGTDILHVGVEFRQDRIEFRSGAHHWAQHFGDALAKTLDGSTVRLRRHA